MISVYLRGIDGVLVFFVHDQRFIIITRFRRIDLLLCLHIEIHSNEANENKMKVNYTH